MQRSIKTAIIISILALCFIPVGAQKNAAPRVGTIAYVRGGTEVRLINADGTNPRTYAPVKTYWWVSWSPDGTKIAFVSNRNGGAEIFVMNADGSNPVQLTHTNSGLSNSQLTWSPDGSKIAFVTVDHQLVATRADIYIEKRFKVFDVLILYAE